MESNGVHSGCIWWVIILNTHINSLSVQKNKKIFIHKEKIMRKLRIIMKQIYPTFRKSGIDLNPNGFSLLKSSESLSVDFYENGI